MYNDIIAHIDHHKSGYINFLNMVRSFFNDSRLPGIRSIYSRSAKQRGDEFKETWKIVQRLETERAKNGTFNVAGVWDIVALTVVFNYDYECESAVIFAKENGKSLFKVTHDTHHVANGYYARHLVAKCQKTDYFGTLCEIQLKTVLHDAWANKTHDLSYKPLDQLDHRIRQQMELIGGMLQGVEKQSEILRSLIEEQWAEDNERRAAARRALILDLLHKRTRERQDVWNIVTELQEKETSLAALDVDSPEIQELIQRIEAICSSGHEGDASVLATYLACLRQTTDLRAVAEHYIDCWIHAVKDSNGVSSHQWRDATHFRAYALYVLGDIRQATALTEKALAEAPPTDLHLKANLAYYLAESPTSSQEQWSKNKKRAELLMAQAEAEGIDLRNPKILNTKGFVKIAFGDTEQQIREGLENCLQAITLAKTDDQKEVGRHFFAFQERKAWRRLLKL